MKATKIVYWTTTSLFAIMMIYSAYAYLTQDAVRQAFQHLGYPDYFRVQLAIAKVIGAVLLLVPVAVRVKEWAYAGFFIVLISAFIAHTVAGDPVVARIAPLVFMVILAISFVSGNKRQSKTPVLEGSNQAQRVAG